MVEEVGDLPSPISSFFPSLFLLGFLSSRVSLADGLLHCFTVSLHPQQMGTIHTGEVLRRTVADGED